MISVAAETALLPLAAHLLPLATAVCSFAENVLTIRLQLQTSGIGVEWSNGQDIAPHELYECSIPA